MSVEFLGERFRVAEKVGALPLMRFAKVAKSGVDANELDGLAALYDVLGQCIHSEDWGRFEAHADKHHADGDQLLAVVQQAFEVIASRPTGRSSDSSDGPQSTEASSTAVSSSPVTTSGAGAVIEEYNRRGRPDLALVVRKAQESRIA